MCTHNIGYYASTISREIFFVFYLSKPRQKQHFHAAQQSISELWINSICKLTHNKSLCLCDISTVLSGMSVDQAAAAVDTDEQSTTKSQR